MNLSESFLEALLTDQCQGDFYKIYEITSQVYLCVTWVTTGVVPHINCEYVPLMFTTTKCLSK